MMIVFVLKALAHGFDQGLRRERLLKHRAKPPYLVRDQLRNAIAGHQDYVGVRVDFKNAADHVNSAHDRHGNIGEGEADLVVALPISLQAVQTVGRDNRPFRTFAPWCSASTVSTILVVDDEPSKGEDEKDEDHVQEGGESSLRRRGLYNNDFGAIDAVARQQERAAVRGCREGAVVRILKMGQRH
jgi:hypothetical protein